MMRVVTLAVYGLALLGMVSAQSTCADTPGFVRFQYAGNGTGFWANLEGRNGTVYGTVFVTVAERKAKNCFQAVFEINGDDVALLRLRAGIFATTDAPTGKDRFTRKKRVRQVELPFRVVGGALYICPSSIPAEISPNCCERPNLVLFATAVITNGDESLRVYMVHNQATSNSSCITMNSEKPFRQACLLPIACPR
ncbi:hypothetical protein NDN08_003835 [Rhodosorus marinus]|uniref:DOMON domain-containing protein n=1 Tax=Rhodosorus marinus TaxID=101924 RepID=A0AAV8UKB5_9RHOD|nr:hypothetical protein NDN08_003835 [Rhodosorus marinus]